MLLEPGATRVRTVTALVRPRGRLPAVVKRLTGLDDADLVGAPPLAEIRPTLAGLLAGRVVVAHNAAFERHFLGAFVDPALSTARYLDTQDLLSVAYPDAADLRLESFTRDLLGRCEEHRALADALDTARVLSRIAASAHAGAVRLDVARRSLERFAPRSPWLAALSAGPAHDELAAPDAPDFVEIGESDEPPVPFDEDAIATALADEARGRRHLAGYRVRHEQIELARQFARNLAGGGTMFLEGGTGVGKSFAYLAAAIPFALDRDRAGAGAAEPVVVSTRTKLLQDQLLHDDIAAVARFLGYPGLRALSIKGRANYVCERRLADVLAEGADASLLEEDRMAYAVLHACARTRPHGEIGTLPGAFLFRQPQLRDLLRRSVATRAEQCTREDCARHPVCPFGKRRAALAKADLIVANHDLLLRWPPDYPRFRHVIVDEGHELAGVADDVYAVTVRPQDLFERIDELFPPDGRGRRRTPGRAPASSRWRRELRQDLAALGRSLEAAASEYGEVELPAFAGDAFPDAAVLAEIAAQRLVEIALAAEAAERLGGARRSSPASPVDEPSGAGPDGRAESARGPSDVERAAGELRLAANGLRAAFRDDADGAVASFESLEAPYDHWTLAIRAVSPAEPFHEGFVQGLDSVALVSASMFVGGDAFAAVGELGIEERTRDGVTKVSVESPFPYADHMRAIALEADADAGFDLVESTALVLATTARRLGGRTLGLFTSLRRMTRVAQRLEQLLRGEGIEILTPRRAADDPRSLVRRFVAASGARRGGAVLLGARKFWQGLDIPGDALQAVVIEKLPFDVPTELRRRREQRIRDEGLDAFDRFTLGKMLLHLKQMTGRLIRSERDRGVVVVVEGRVTRPYFEELGRALPAGVDVRAVGAERWEAALDEALAELELGVATGES